jgi:hypothetical protein
MHRRGSEASERDYRASQLEGSPAPLRARLTACAGVCDTGYDALLKSHQERIEDLREQLSAERRANEENRCTILLTEVAVGVFREHLARQVEHMQHLGDLY